MLILLLLVSGISAVSIGKLATLTAASNSLVGVKSVDLVDSSRFWLYRSGSVMQNSIVRSTVLNVLLNEEGDPRSYYKDLGYTYESSAMEREMRREAKMFLGLSVRDYLNYLEKEGRTSELLKGLDGCEKFSVVFQEMHKDRRFREGLVDLVDGLDFDDTDGELCLLPGFVQMARRRRMTKNL
jgi:hypothetical protein